MRSFLSMIVLCLGVARGGGAGANGGTTNYIGCNNGCCVTSCRPASEVGNC